MKATLEFDLNDPEQAKEHLRCIKSSDMACALFRLIYNNKHLETKEEFLEKIEEVCCDYSIDIEELLG